MEAYCSGPGTTDISLFCEKCGASVDIIGSRGKLRKANPGRPLTWEYVIMAIGIVKYGRVKNLGDYGTEWFEAEYVLESGENVDGAVAECKAFVKRQLGTGPSEDDLEQARELLRENGEL